jgi:hypothetical protein
MHSVGAFAIGANEKERIDIIRNALLARDKAFIFHGERGSGKSALATQLAAVLARPYMPIPSSQGKPYLVSSGGEGTVVDLSEQGAQDLAKGLGAGMLVHLTDADPHLQPHVARALADPGEALTLQPLDSSGQPQGAALSASASPASVAIFELSGMAEGELDVADSSQLTPLFFYGLSDTAQEAIANGKGYVPKGGAQAEPWEDTDGGAEVKAVVDVLSRYASPPRSVLCTQILGALRKANPSFSGPEAYSFVERWLRLVEIQAYGGDNMAARTLALSLKGFAPGVDWLPEVRSLVDPRAHSLFVTGEAARAAIGSRAA